jgi:hypothetical protein
MGIRSRYRKVFGGGARVLACREKGRRARKIIFVLALVVVRRVRWIMSVVVKGG